MWPTLGTYIKKILLWFIQWNVSITKTSRKKIRNVDTAFLDVRPIFLVCMKPLNELGLEVTGAKATCHFAALDMSPPWEQRSWHLPSWVEQGPCKQISPYLNALLQGLLPLPVHMGPGMSTSSHTSRDLCRRKRKLSSISLLMAISYPQEPWDWCIPYLRALSLTAIARKKTMASNSKLHQG